MDPLAKWLERLERALMAVATLAAILMAVSISMDAVGRYVFHRPMLANYEFTSYFCMVAITFLGLPAVYAQGGQIRLTLLEASLERVPYDLSARLNSLLAFVAFALIAIYAGMDALEKIEMRETTFGAVQFPIYLSFACFPLGCAAISLRLLLEVFVPRRRASADSGEEFHH